MMWYNGRMIRVLVLLFTLAIMSSSHATFKQFLGGEEGKYIEGQSIPNHHVPGWDEKSPYEAPQRRPESGSVHVPGVLEHPEDLPANRKTDHVNAGIRVAGEGARAESYIGMDGDQILKDVNRRGSYSYSFKYINDGYNYLDSNNVFNKTFQEGSGSIQGGYLHLGGERFLWRNYIDVAFTGQVGLGYNRGRGVFVDGELSSTQMQLWLLPIDAGLSVAVPLGPWAVLRGAGGPSLMGVIQTRNDRAREDTARERRQMSVGYYAEGSLRLNLSRIFPSTGFSVFRDYRASNFYMDLVIRDHRYENFKDEFTISGQSFGVGFSLDFL